MQIYGAVPLDQHLLLDNNELTDLSSSLENLGVFPGTTLNLKVRIFCHFACWKFWETIFF